VVWRLPCPDVRSGVVLMGGTSMVGTLLGPEGSGGAFLHVCSHVCGWAFLIFSGSWAVLSDIPLPELVTCWSRWWGLVFGVRDGGPGCCLRTA